MVVVIGILKILGVFEEEIIDDMIDFFCEM